MQLDATIPSSLSFSVTCCHDHGRGSLHAQAGMLVALEHVSGGARIHLFALLAHGAPPCADFFVQSAMAQTSGRGALRR